MNAVNIGGTAYGYLEISFISSSHLYSSYSFIFFNIDRLYLLEFDDD